MAFKSPFHGNTIETCEGTSCARCKIAIDMCACRPRNLSYRSVSERITGQGWLPATDWSAVALVEGEV